LLNEAETHYRRELEKKISPSGDSSKGSEGFFTALGRFFDKPIIDTTSKKKDEDELL